MNDAQKFLIDNHMNDLVISKRGEAHVYTSDAMVIFAKDKDKVIKELKD